MILPVRTSSPVQMISMRMADSLAEKGPKRLDHRGGPLAGHEMAHAGHDPALRPSRELGQLGLGRRRPGYTVIAAMEHDRWYRDRRPARQAFFDVVEAWIAGRVAVAVTVRVDHDRHEVRVVEGRRREVIGGVLEVPARRPLLPEQLAELAAVLLETQPPA